MNKGNSGDNGGRGRGRGQDKRQGGGRPGAGGGRPGENPWGRGQGSLPGDVGTVEKTKLTSGRGEVQAKEVGHVTGDKKIDKSIVKTDSPGTVRGKRQICEIVETRPKNLVSKCGSSGKTLMVQTNYFHVVKRPNWKIYQYNVDFSPEVDVAVIRRGLVNEHKAKFGAFIFDGLHIFSMECFTNGQPNDTIECVCKLRNGDPVVLKIKFVRVVDPKDVQQLSLLNLIFRRAMSYLNQQNVNRNLFDPNAKV